MDFTHDAIGYAICDYVENGFTENITVIADLCEDDVMPIEYMFRTEEMMPDIERKALSLCNGTILDVGAAAGCHSYTLHKKGMNVKAIDTSGGAVFHLKNLGLDAEKINFFDLKGQFDTILVLMNGIGIAGKLANLPRFLSHLKSLISPGGMALCDSTDLSYLYQEEDGSMWVDLNGSYLGEMQFKMKYKDVESNWFPWLYIEFDLLKEQAENAGLNCTLIMEGTSNNYLVSLTHK